MKKSTRFYLAAIIGTIALFALFFLFSSFFHVREVIIGGNQLISDEEIHMRLNIGENTHLLLYNARNARRRIMLNNYVGDVRIERAMPGRLYVNVVERRLTAYVEHMPGSFLFLDDTGRVLEIRNFFTEPLPVLIGLQFTRFQIGEVLEVPDPAAFNVIVQYTQLLYHYGLINQVSHINVADASSIRILIHNIEFDVGGVTNADEKVRVIVQVLETMPNVGLIPGFMNLREIRPQYSFEILQ
jgi:cell division septal protein FtsQ